MQIDASWEIDAADTIQEPAESIDDISLLSEDSKVGELVWITSGHYRSDKGIGLVTRMDDGWASVLIGGQICLSPCVDMLAVEEALTIREYSSVREMR